MESPGTIVIGGGAAGLTAAAVAPGGALVLEKLAEPGRKLLATGGGRCNFTRDESAESVMRAFGKNGRFMRDALSVFGSDDIRSFFAERGVESVVEDGGRVFPSSGKSKSVLNALLSAVHENGSEIKCSSAVRRIFVRERTPENESDKQNKTVTGIELEGGEVIEARRIILASGGICRPSLGSDGDGFEMASGLGLDVTTPVPALTGLSVRERWPGTLSGLSIPDAELQINAGGKQKSRQRGALLFTHKGISGPAVLNLSGDVVQTMLRGGANGVPLVLSVCADMTPDLWLKLFSRWRTRTGARTVAGLLAEKMPRALAEAFRRESGIAADTTAARFGRREMDILAGLCCGCTLTAVSAGGRDEAMVTRGGIALAEINPKTMESRKISGLFFAGEAVDLDGPCGGYNLTWAFSSGHLAGSSDRR